VLRPVGGGEVVDSVYVVEAVANRMPVFNVYSPAFHAQVDKRFGSAGRAHERNHFLPVIDQSFGQMASRETRRSSDQYFPHS
jgi:hypothetical protein